jgi:hypothetical protein
LKVVLLPFEQCLPSLRLPRWTPSILSWGRRRSSSSCVRLSPSPFHLSSPPPRRRHPSPFRNDRLQSKHPADRLHSNLVWALRMSLPPSPARRNADNPFDAQKAISPVCEKLANQYRNVTFLKVDVDAAQDIARAYGVRSRPFLPAVSSFSRLCSPFSPVRFPPCQHSCS